jgi:PPM family protein phosphatase
MNCRQCGGIVIESDRFCEECGVSIIPTRSSQKIDLNCQKCGSPIALLDPDACASPNGDRYCLACGFRQVKIAKIADRPIELQPAPILAGASDRGRRHHQNEDAIVLNVIDTDTYVLVVCDGVSSSQHPELASQTAATACSHEIVMAIEEDTTLTTAIDRGIAAALTSVSQIPFDPELSEDSSSTTIVTAIVRDNTISIGWLGDSRAYWISDRKSCQLTEDDSWSRAAIAAGEITPEAAEASPYAHAITRWIGGDLTDDDDNKPNLTTFTIPTSGYLLLCTDGLWNYAPDSTSLYHLTQQAASKNPLDIARHLIKYANQQGGQDNITVGILASGQRTANSKQ